MLLLRLFLASLFIVFFYSSSIFHFTFWSTITSLTSPRLRGQDPSLRKHPKRLSHQSAWDPDQDVLPENATWLDTDGTPRFYNAWRAKPGRLTAEPSRRSQWYKHSARVACWPSTDGVWIKQADLVELNWLGLPRFRDEPRQFDQVAEDEFCIKLKMLGAEWWSLPADFSKRVGLGAEQFACETLESCFEPAIKTGYLVAWPEDEDDPPACCVRIDVARMREKYHERGTQLDMLSNAQSMLEKCLIYTSLGGEWCHCKTWCEDACPGLGDVEWGVDGERESTCP